MTATRVARGNMKISGWTSGQLRPVSKRIAASVAALETELAINVEPAS